MLTQNATKTLSFFALSNVVELLLHATNGYSPVFGGSSDYLAFA